MESAIDDKIARLKGLIAFTKEHSRFPNSQELMQFGGFGNIPCDPDSADDFRIKVKFFEKWIAFLETNRRSPTNDELPDPF